MVPLVVFTATSIIHCRTLGLGKKGDKVSAKLEEFREKKHNILPAGNSGLKCSVVPSIFPSRLVTKARGVIPQLHSLHLTFKHCLPPKRVA